MRSTLYAIHAEKFETAYLTLPQRMPASRWESMVETARNGGLPEEAVDEMRPADVITEGEAVSLSGSAANVVLELCKSECVTAEYEIGDTDFFFADLAARPPDAERVIGGARVAWQDFLKAVDVAAAHRDELPWWLRAAARWRCASSGLLTPAETRLVSEHRAELLDLLTAESDPDGCPDAEGLLDVIATSAKEGGWVLGWEPGT